MTFVYINNKYVILKEWLNSLHSIFETEGTLIYNKRNTVKVFELPNNLLLNVKRFKKPHFFNRIVYTFIRKSKAHRSYINTSYIIAKGFLAPEAVAYIEIKKHGLLFDSFFVCIHCNNVDPISNYYNVPLNGHEVIIDEFAKYTAYIHNAGIIHPDYSPGNILIKRDNNDIKFIMIDLNRVKFKKVTFHEGCKNLERMFCNDELYKRISLIYTKMRNSKISADKTFMLMRNYKNSYIAMRNNKQTKKYA